MILTLLLTIGSVGLFAILMSVGLLTRGKELKGTCASQNATLFGDDSTCGLCGKPVGTCDEEPKKSDLQTI